MEFMRRYESGPYIWRRFGIGFGATDWPNGYRKMNRYHGLVRQRNLRLGPVSVYSLVLMR